MRSARRPSALGCVIIIICVVLSVLIEGADAQNDTFTQNGSWSCQYPIVVPPSQYTCPTVLFPKAFGIAPNVTFVNTSTSGGGRGVKFTVTAEGFTPIVDRPEPPCTNKMVGRPGHGGRVTCVPFGGAFPAGGASGDWIAVGPPLVNATVTPKYLVLTIIYAPPGMHGPKGTGTITYQQGSSVGTTTSASTSFKQAYTVSASADAGFFGSGGSNELTVGYSRSVTDKQSLDIKVSQTGGLKGQGSDMENGVDNDNDAIYLALSPKVNLQLAPSLVQWTFASPKDFVVTHVFVAWLKNPSLFQTEAPSIKRLLLDNGITEQDYADILKRDPLATVVAPPPDRYELRSSFDYVPPHPCDIQPLTTTLTFQREQTSTSEHAVTDEYDVGITHQDNVGFGSSDDGVTLTLKLSGKWTWTNESSVAHSSSTTDTASLAAGGPSCGYNGATRINAYFDKVYGTYAFREDNAGPALQGTITAAAPTMTISGVSTPSHGIATAEAAPAPIRSIEVRLVDATGHEQRTFTNAEGQWTFVGPLTFPVQVTANGVTQVYHAATPGAEINTQVISRDKFIRK